MKNRDKLFKIYILCCLIALVVLYTITWRTSIQLQNQLVEKDNIINSLTVKNEFYAKYLSVYESDSVSGIILSKDKDGKCQTYGELADEVSRLSTKVKIQDIIIIKAKQRYKFNYSYQYKNDTLVVSFWDKEPTSPPILSNPLPSFQNISTP